MWVLNKETKKTWEVVDEELVERLKKDPHYQEVANPVKQTKKKSEK